jgi:multiple sugar transport system substrate-binding protein
MLLAGSCSSGGGGGDRAEIYLQRFFGECGAEYGSATDVSKVEGECGIITAMINKFNAQNSDVHVSSNVVAWPGYPQLSAQMAAKDPPDLVTMHTGVISDYAAEGLLEPVEPFLAEAGLSPSALTDASRSAVTIGGRLYGLPFDTHGGLFHINTRLFAEAGLMKGGKPVLPSSPEEMMAHARQFKERTGKPYLIQSLVGDNAYAARNVYTYLLAQNAVLFPTPRTIRLQTPEAVRIVDFFRNITASGVSTLNQDTPAAIGSFMSGEGGIYPTGTWMIGQFEAEANTEGRPLYRGYAVYPYPRLWGKRRELRKRPCLGRAQARAYAGAAPRNRSVLPFHRAAQFRLGAHRPPSRLQGGGGKSRLPGAASPGQHRAGCDHGPAAAGRSAAPERDRRPGRRGNRRSLQRPEIDRRALADAERRVNELLAQTDS